MGFLRFTSICLLLVPLLAASLALASNRHCYESGISQELVRVVIVDGPSSGNLLAPAFRAAGAAVFHVRSPDLPADMVAGLRPADYLAGIEHQGDLAATLAVVAMVSLLTDDNATLQSSIAAIREMQDAGAFESAPATPDQVREVRQKGVVPAIDPIRYRGSGRPSETRRLRKR